MEAKKTKAPAMSPVSTMLPASPAATPPAAPSVTLPAAPSGTPLAAPAATPPAVPAATDPAAATASISTSAWAASIISELERNRLPREEFERRFRLRREHLVKKLKKMSLKSYTSKVSERQQLFKLLYDIRSYPGIPNPEIPMISLRELDTWTKESGEYISATELEKIFQLDKYPHTASSITFENLNDHLHLMAEHKKVTRDVMLHAMITNGAMKYRHK